MNTANVLQQKPQRYTSSWRSREIQVWIQNSRKILLKPVLVGCVFRLISFLFSESSPSRFLAAVGCVVLLIVTLLLLFGPTQRDSLEKLKMILYLQFLQFYFTLFAVTLYPCYYDLFVTCSTMLFCCYEIQSFHSWVTNAGLFLRQIVVWHIGARYLENLSGTQGMPYYFIVGTLIVALGFTDAVRDRIIDHYRYCDSVEEQEANIKNILQAIPDGLAVITSSMSLPCTNTKLQHILNSDATSTHIYEKLNLLHCVKGLNSTECTQISLLEQVSSFIQEETLHVTNFGVTNNSDCYFEWKGTKCVWGESNACILTASDMSPWAIAQSRLQQESDSKTSLLRFVSHELRTPTNAILNLASEVQEAPNILPEQKTDLSMVITSTYFLLSVINDLLDFSRMIADKFTLVKQSFDVRKEIQESVQLVALQCVQKGIYLTTQFDDLVPEVIYSDPNRLKQVMLNLLGNAVKFTFKGGIRVICTMTDRNTLRISIKDTGIGIAEDKIAGLFKAFGTVDGTQRINPQGCGLGLYISNLLCQSLGSSFISIKSQVGKGSEFSFIVNMYQEDNDVPGGVVDGTTDIASEREDEASIPGSPVKAGQGQIQLRLPDVLVVDDSEFNRMVLHKMLESLQVRSDQASTGLRALALIRAGLRRGHCYRLVLMDVEMPEMDGVTAAHEIRMMQMSGELPGDIRIVACSAHRSREDIDRCIQSGMNGYLEKPISRMRLHELVQSL